LLVATTLRQHLVEEVELTGPVQTMDEAPPPGKFCAKELMLGSRKADLILRLWDGRLVPIECKVSNSALNSIKRVNDVSEKAGRWTNEFGSNQIVPIAVLSGVFGHGKLTAVQRQGLTLIWTHRMADLTDLIGPQP
jgi:hypothetical protein